MKKEKYDSKLESFKDDKKRLWGVIIGLIIALLLSLGLNFSKKDDVTVEVAPQFLSKSVSVTGGRFNDAYYEQMARYWVSLLFNFTPNTVKYQFNEFLRFVSPRDYATIRKKLSTQAKSIISNGSSSSFHPMEIKINKDNIIVHGELIGMVGEQIVNRRITSYMFGVESRNGLRVTSVKEVVIEGKDIRVIKNTSNEDFLDKKDVALQPSYDQ